MKNKYPLFATAVFLLLVIGAGFLRGGQGHSTETVTIRGTAFSETGETLTVEREEDVALIVRAFERAERTEGAVKGIGNNLTFTFHQENGETIEYPVWKGTDSASFQDPAQKTETEQGDVRYAIAEEEWERMLRLLEPR
ncbi:hypothetical protein ACTL32_09030 [Planococcus sp. FY231025]|uniref:hypothetical protein n=1 Tax=Planococcus sp. FY231025 TaxID=3455699 RepID=UPI003F91E87F